MKDRLKEIISDKGKRTVFDLVAGIVSYGMIVLLGGGIVRCFFPYKYYTFATGSLLGMLIAVFMVMHMYSVLERAMLCDKVHAKRKTKFGALLRMFVMACALTASVLLPQALSVWGVMAGILTLKIAALTQPLIDRFIAKFVKKEE